MKQLSITISILFLACLLLHFAGAGPGEKTMEGLLTDRTNAYYWASGDSSPSLLLAFPCGSISFTNAGPTDNLDVTGIDLVHINTTNNNVTIGGFFGGVAGQRLSIIVTNGNNNTILEHAEGTGNQDMALSSAGDETITAKTGGWDLYYDGSRWIEVDH